MKTESLIQNVSDTALWVAHYRALETERSDSLFQDTLAKELVGEKGKKIAESMTYTTRYTQWSLVIRTWIIDRYLSKLIQEGVDVVLNLGAGLDTRPYRMELPSHLKWIEVDYPHLIDYKESKLQSEKPRCQLERVRLDLANRSERIGFFQKVAGEGKKILVLTEGVIPYLSESAVGELADDLRTFPSFHYWIAEYFAPETYRYFNTSKLKNQMKNAPFRFFPTDWFGFFKSHGWHAKEVQYLGENSLRLNRKIPGPWWVSILKHFMNEERKLSFLRFMGYVVYEPV